MSEKSGHLDWNGWSFDYDVSGMEGLSLLNGFFRGRRVFAKLSLPVIRVKYTQDEQWPLFNPVWKNGCGPYNDQITWDPEDPGENINFVAGPHHLVRMSGECGNRYVCILSFVAGGRRWLRLAVYARIGAYHIVQDWTLGEHGVVKPRVFSKGLSCNLDHWHHPYWRFDIDLDGEGEQRVNVFDGFFYAGFVDGEGALVDTDHRSYNIENLRTGAKCWIQRQELDPEAGIVGPTEFSRVDAYVRKFRASEDRNWPHAAGHEIGFAVHENPDGGDIVFWSIGHLFHREDEGHDHWHSIGPTLLFELPETARDPTRILAPSPARFRRVRVNGAMHVKDFALVGHDGWGHFDFDEIVELDPLRSHAELAIRRGPVGDVTAILRVRIDLASDHSIAVGFDASLFDEGDVVAADAAQLNVVKDGAQSVAVRLRDHHAGDPDTADIDLTITNAQA